MFPSSTALQPVQIALGLGSNLGEPLKLISKAVSQLEARGLSQTNISSLYETEPVDCIPDTPPFINAAITGIWQESPEKLLKACQKIEIDLGRPAKHCSRSARTIDIDILLFGDQIFHSPKLQIPHPRLCKRLFALLPLLEIAPDWQIPPSDITVADACDALLQTFPTHQSISLINS